MPEMSGQSSDDTPEIPGEGQRERQSMADYVVSLPERFVRTAAAGGGGLLLEAADHILPPPVRGAKIYQCLIARPLRITVEAVGGVSDRFPEQAVTGQELIKRKIAGNVVEAASVFTVGFSPLWFLAVASDVTGGTRIYLETFVRELKWAGVLQDSTDVSSVDDLLNVLDRTARQAADAIDIPPTAIADMRDSLDLFRENSSLIPGPKRLGDVFTQLNEAANEQKRSLLVVSTLVAAAAVGAGVQLSSIHILSFYTDALAAIRREGASEYLARISQPYIEAATDHMDPSRPAHTPRLIRRFLDHRPASGPDTTNWTDLR